MDAIGEFSLFKRRDYALSTRRAYVSAAKKALKLIENQAKTYSSYKELFSLLIDFRQENALQGLRIGPFLRFLSSQIPVDEQFISDSYQRNEPIRAWILNRIEEETKTGNPSIFVRRDLAMLAGLCFAPDQPSPRWWPRSALQLITAPAAIQASLWGKTVDTKELQMPLLYWYSWRQRLDRPEQGRLFRKSWSNCDLLFPDSQGAVLKKQAMHNALARLIVKGEGRVRLTPEAVRRAFLH
jgi:hypothetical protein